MLSDAEWAQLQKKLRLTDREPEVLQGLLDEQTDQAIATDLGITSRTVRAHLDNVYRTCHCRTRTGAVISVFETLRRSEIAR